jgi:hypothetical protein
VVYQRDENGLAGSTIVTIGLQAHSACSVSIKNNACRHYAM